MSEIAGRNALITGGASGIGRLMALKMARLGGHPVIWDIDPQRLAEVLAELKSATGREACGYLCDVADRRDVYAVAAKVRNEVGPVHILINNAGIVSGRCFLDCSDEEIQRTMDVKTRFPFLLPILKKEYVAERIVRAIRRNRPRVFLPRWLGLVTALRFLPPSVFDAVARFLGINRSMEEFVGRR